MVFCLKRAARIELASLAWKAKVLPLNYARKYLNSITITLIFKFYKYFLDNFCTPQNGTYLEVI